jgi:ABC-type multidrug transport system fused ATPase/permease subunit
MTSNIAFLEENVNLRKVQEAITSSCLDGLVGSSNPDDVFVDEFGKNLSGGQKQRVAIARALYHNAELIILDEATSALDNETEQAIIETVDRLKGSGITIVIIADRLSTLKNVDYTLKVENQLLHKVL